MPSFGCVVSERRKRDYVAIFHELCCHIAEYSGWCSTLRALRGGQPAWSSQPWSWRGEPSISGCLQKWRWNLQVFKESDAFSDNYCDVATRKRKAPAKSDRLIEGLVWQFAMSKKDTISMCIATEERHYKLTADMEESGERWPSGRKRGSMKWEWSTRDTPIRGRTSDKVITQRSGF